MPGKVTTQYAHACDAAAVCQPPSLPTVHRYSSAAEYRTCSREHLITAFDCIVTLLFTYFIFVVVGGVLT